MWGSMTPTCLRAAMSTEVALFDADIQTPEYQAMAVLWRVARAVAEPSNEMCPQWARGKPGAVFSSFLAAAALTGKRDPHELIVLALKHVYVVHGHLSTSASIMRATIRARGHRIEVLAKTDERCTLRGTRADTGETEEVTWTMDDAERARLVKAGGAWETYPRRMLFARATSELADSLFPDLLAGFAYTPEEVGGVPAAVDVLDLEEVIE